MMSADDKRRERLLGFDQQFEFQVAMVLSGIVPHGGSSIDFIIKMLDRQNYDPVRLTQMRNLAPWIKEEIDYIKLKERVDHLESKRRERMKRINAFVYGEDAC